MKKKIDLKNICDIMYEPKRLKIYPNGQIRYEEKFSLIEFNGRRKEITEQEFRNLIQHLL